MGKIILFVFLSCLYLLPSGIALARDHPSRRAIVALNILLGWTLIGWIVALIWSLTATQPRLLPPAD